MATRHADPAVTLRVYSHVLREHAQGIGDVFAQAIRPRSASPLATAYFAWLAAGTMLGLNDIIVKATPDQALALVQSAENGEPDQTAIAAQLAAFSDRNPRQAARSPNPHDHPDERMAVRRSSLLEESSRTAWH